MQDMEGRTNTNQTANPNYLAPLQDKIMPEVMRCLLIESKDDLDFPEMRSSAAKSIGTFVAIGNHETINIVINGVATVLQSGNIGHQQATCILLSTICEATDKAYAFKNISDAFDQTLGLLNSNESIVVSNTLNGLATIA